MNGNGACVAPIRCSTAFRFAAQVGITGVSPRHPPLLLSNPVSPCAQEEAGFYYSSVFALPQDTSPPPPVVNRSRHVTSLPGNKRAGAADGKRRHDGGGDARRASSVGQRGAAERPLLHVRWGPGAAGGGGRSTVFKQRLGLKGGGSAGEICARGSCGAAATATEAVWTRHGACDDVALAREGFASLGPHEGRRLWFGRRSSFPWDCGFVCILVVGPGCLHTGPETFGDARERWKKVASGPGWLLCVRLAPPAMATS